eukprot:1159968-Pelagomonas_calceolata.AAC.19
MQAAFQGLEGADEDAHLSSTRAWAGGRGAGWRAVARPGCVKSNYTRLPRSNASKVKVKGGQVLSKALSSGGKGSIAQSNTTAFPNAMF